MGKRKYWTAEEKLQAILYVQSSNSVVQACRELGIDLSMYYKWKKAYEEKGEEGLKPKYPKIDPELERLRKENERLKKLLAEKELELEIAREFIKKNLKSTEEKVKAVGEFMRKYPALSLKRICRVLAISRSTYYLYRRSRPPASRGRPPTKETYNLLREEKVSDEEVVREIEEILSGKFVLYGYRKVTAALRRKGYVINHKKVYRLMEERSLLLKELWKEKAPKKKGTAPEEIEAPNKKWSIDIKHCKALNGERGYVIAVKDCYTKEVIAVAVERRHTYQEVESVMYRAFAERNFKELALEELYVTSDNGKEIIKAMKSLEGIGIKHCRITPRSPWENGEIESFFSCLEREVFRRFEIEDFEQMKRLVTEYVGFYNTERIHGGIGYKTPRERYLEYVSSQPEVLSNVG